MTLTIRSALVALLLTLPLTARAACTEQNQESKVSQLSTLMTSLSQKNPARAQKISEEMMNVMMQDWDEACASLDKLIAQAK